MLKSNIKDPSTTSTDAFLVPFVVDFEQVPSQWVSRNLTTILSKSFGMF